LAEKNNEIELISSIKRKSKTLVEPNDSENKLISENNPQKKRSNSETIIFKHDDSKQKEKTNLRKEMEEKVFILNILIKIYVR